eukprot:6312830-Prymnesium_polylepis.1
MAHGGAGLVGRGARRGELHEHGLRPLRAHDGLRHRRRLLEVEDGRERRRLQRRSRRRVVVGAAGAAAEDLGEQRAGDRRRADLRVHIAEVGEARDDDLKRQVVVRRARLRAEQEQRRERRLALRRLERRAARCPVGPRHQQRGERVRGLLLLL